METEVMRMIEMMATEMMEMAAMEMMETVIVRIHT
jgi:hypothetical protein